jgi:hypothetical protein
MIFRRFAEAIRRQDWFTVFVETMIVVLGVFLGLQVNNWNEAQQERAKERVLLGRLHLETRSLIAANREEFKMVKTRGDRVLSINPVLFSQEALRPATVEECEGISGTHVYRLGPDELPAIDEMIETGRFDLLSNEVIKAQLRGYVLFRARVRSAHAERTAEIFRLHSRYPELIAVTRAPKEEGYAGRWDVLAGEGYRFVVNCNVEEMRENVGFLNDYVDNLARTANTIQAFEERERLLMSIEATLAGELGVAPLAGGRD